MPLDGELLMFVFPDPNLDFPAFYFSMICHNPFTRFDSPNEDLATVFLGRPNTPIRHVLPEAPIGTDDLAACPAAVGGFSSATSLDQLRCATRPVGFIYFTLKGWTETVRYRSLIIPEPDLAGHDLIQRLELVCISVPTGLARSIRGAHPAGGPRASERADLPRGLQCR